MYYKLSDLVRNAKNELLQRALEDCNTALKINSNHAMGYNVRGLIYVRFNKPDSALTNFNKCLDISPDADYALNNRGILLASVNKKYDEAIADFSKAIGLNSKGDYYLNRSFCYYGLGDLTNAKADAITAMQKGITIQDNYRQLLNLKN